MFDRIINKWVVAVTFAGAAMAPLAASAATMAGDYLGVGFSGLFSRATGYEFTMNSTVTVTALGVFDFGADGLSDRHQVGIFRKSDNSPVVNTFIGAGTASALVAGTVDGSRFEDAFAVLNAGESYYILADNFSSDRFVFGTGAVVYNPAVTWGGFVDASTNSIFSTPTFFGGGQPGNLGPNFLFVEGTTVPVPASVFLVLLGVAGVGLTRRRGA